MLQLLNEIALRKQHIPKAREYSKQRKKKEQDRMFEDQKTLQERADIKAHLNYLSTPLPFLDTKINSHE